ncbi:pilus assembly FimT family protein [Neptunicella sp.]|uniref:pilus assembly FimT family protein n=1 Tax=Neptunicella sp. TaxID=2125986 RepID=UPI003F6905A7
MYRIAKNQNGFTMIELLVTLVLIGLISAMVAPQLDSWLASRRAAAIRMEISSQFAMLPLKANRSGQAILIDSASKLNITDAQLTFPHPVMINANGFCQGGRFQLQQADTLMDFDVLSPFCEVRRVIQN